MLRRVSLLLFGLREFAEHILYNLASSRACLTRPGIFVFPTTLSLLSLTKNSMLQNTGPDPFWVDPTRLTSEQ